MISIYSGCLCKLIYKYNFKRMRRRKSVSLIQQILYSEYCTLNVSYIFQYYVYFLYFSSSERPKYIRIYDLRNITLRLCNDFLQLCKHPRHPMDNLPYYIQLSYSSLFVHEANRKLPYNQVDFKPVRQRINKMLVITSALSRATSRQHNLLESVYFSITLLFLMD